MVGRHPAVKNHKDSGKRSQYITSVFRNASAMGLCCIVLNAYLIWRHWQALSVYAVTILCIPIGLQLAGQWWRAFRYYARMREIYSAASTKDSQVESYIDVALQASVVAMADFLLWSYVSNLMMLLYIGALLSRSDGIK